MKITLKGASLVEALVASVIFLTVFLIAMNSLIGISRIRISSPSPVEIEDAVEECISRFRGESDDSRSYDYWWGVVEVEAKSYKTSDEVLDVTVSAKAKNGRTVIYRYIVNDNEK